MIDKRVESAAAAIDGVGDGAVVMISGFQGSGAPNALLDALLAKRLRGLTLVVNGVGHHGTRVAGLFAARSVAKVICSSARAGAGRPGPFEEQWKRGEVELELVPQGTLAERIRAGAAGIAGFYTPVAVGTKLAEGKEVREFDGKAYLLERALTADLSVLRADRADRWGNLTYHAGQRNFGTVMAMAARITAVEVNEVSDELAQLARQGADTGDDLEGSLEEARERVPDRAGDAAEEGHAERDVGHHLDGGSAGLVDDAHGHPRHDEDGEHQQHGGQPLPALQFLGREGVGHQRRDEPAEGHGGHRRHVVAGAVNGCRGVEDAEQAVGVLVGVDLPHASLLGERGS